MTKTISEVLRRLNHSAALPCAIRYGHNDLRFRGTMQQLQSAFGVIALLMLAWGFGENRRAVSMEQAAIGLVAKVLTAVALIKFPRVTRAFGIERRPRVLLALRVFGHLVNTRVFVRCCVAATCTVRIGIYKAGIETTRFSMKVILSAAAVALLATSAASAADLATKAPMYAKAPVVAPFSWTGFYIGGNVGWAQTKADYSSAVTANNGFTNASAAFVGAIGTGSATKSGVTGGGQIGYNWQFSPNWVFGVEGDINALSQTASLVASGVTPGGTTITNFTNSVQSEWIATFRGRVGYAFDRSLIYATGGLAVLGSKYSQTFVASFPVSAVNSHSEARAGWTVGGGWEYGLTQHWSVKAEYLYARFTGLSVTSAGGVAINPGFNDILSGRANVNFQTARAGINYRF